MEQSLMNSTDVPFLWGVATSGYQSEGGYNGVGQPQNNWSIMEQQGRVMTTGKAVDFWTRYEEDLKRCRQLGLNSFRIGLEWSRIQPSTSVQPAPAPPFDVEALNAYAERIAACRRCGLEPIVTLHHFTHPAWLELDAWLSDETVEAFTKYVRVTLSHVNHRLVEHYQLPPIRWYVTINEPNILAPNTYLSGQFPMGGKAWGIKAVLGAYNHLLTAHTRSYNFIHDLYEAEGWQTPYVSFNTYCSDLYWSEKFLWDLLSFKQQGIKQSELLDYLNSNAKALEIALLKADLPFRRDLPYQAGKIVRRVARWFGRKAFDIQTFNTFLQELDSSPRSQVFDYIGIDYYDPFFAHTFRLPSFSDFEFKEKDFRGWLMSGITSKWWDWRSLPEGLHFFCQFYATEYQKPILIAENGMALRRKPNNGIADQRRDRLRRSDFLKAHLEQIKRLRQEGVPLAGYMHWSLTDNYEWGSYTPRFGLFTVDFEAGMERMVEDHLGDCPSETYAQLIREINLVGGSCPPYTN